MLRILLLVFISEIIIFENLGKNELDLSEELQVQNKNITDKMNKIKNKYISIKNNPLYLEVLSGRLNLENIKNSQTLLEDNTQSIVYLEKFMVESQNFFEDIKDTLSDIIYYKQNEQDRQKEILSTILNKTVYDLNQQERMIQDKGDLSELILYQFQVLEKSLCSDNSRQNVDLTLESTMMRQLKENQTNYHLHNVAADIVRLEKQKEEQRRNLQEGQLKKTKEYSSQIANLMTKPIIDKDRTIYPVKDYSKNEYNDENQGHGSSSVLGLADKLLQTIKQRRQEDIDKERKIKEEQDQVRYLKEQQHREERERMQYEKQKALDSTNKKFQERREQEQNEHQQRIQQRQKDEQDRKQQDLERQREDDYKKQRAEEDRRNKQRESEELRKQRDEDEKLKKKQDDERRKQKEEDERQIKEDLKKQRDEDERRRQLEREENSRKQREEEDRRRKLQDEEDQRRKQEDENKRKQKELDDQRRKQNEEDERKRQQQADEERRKKIDEDDRKRQEEQRKRDEQRKIQLEEEEKQRKQQQEDDRKRQDELKRKREDEEKERKQKVEEDEKRRKQEEDEKRKQREEDEKRKEEERKKQEDERKKQEDERKKQEEERKKQEENKKKQEEEKRKQKEEDDKRKKQEEEQKRLQKEEEEIKKKEEEEKKRKQKEEEEEKKRKQKEDEERKKKEKEEEEKKQKKLKEEELARKAKEEQEAQKNNKKQSGFNYGDMGASDNSESQYQEDFEIDDYDEILGVDNSKNKKTNEQPKKNKDFDQEDLYEDIADDSENFNDLVGTKNTKNNKSMTTQNTTANTNTKKIEPPKNVKNNKYDDFEEFDDNFDDFDDDELDDKKKPSLPEKNKPVLIPLKEDNSKQVKKLNSYEDDFEIEDLDDFSENKKKTQLNTNNKNDNATQNKKLNNQFDDIDDYNNDFEDIEEDIDDLMGDGSNKNDKPVPQTKIEPAVKKPTTLQPLQDKNKKQNFDDNEEEDVPEVPKKDVKKEEKNIEKNEVKKANDLNKKKDENDFDYDFPEDEDDFQEGGQQQQGQQQQLTQEQMEQLMQDQEAQNMELTYELIQKTNEYIKKTRFGRSNRVNLSKFNTYDYIIRLYEEYLSNLSVFIFDYNEGNKLLDLYEAFVNQSDDIEGLVEEYGAELQKVYYDYTQMTDFHPQTKLYFPLEPNQLGFQLIEVNLMNSTISYFYMVEESEESLIQQLNEFHKFLMIALRFDQFAAQPSKVEDNTLKVLQIYEKEPHLQYMIMLFPLIYEFMSDMSEIMVDQDTIDRIFYIQLSLEYFYTELENKQEDVTNKFNTMIDSYQNHKNFFIAIQDYEQWSAEVVEMIIQDMNQIQNDVLNSTEKKYGLVMFSIIAGQTQFCFYFYVQKSNDDKTPHEIGLFCLNMSDQINDQLIDSFESLAQENVAFRPHVDSARHNGLYEYSEFTIASWANLIEKKNLSPFVALNIINFSMVPYYITYKGLD